MGIVESISKKISSLPESLQLEVLTFTEFLISKNSYKRAVKEEEQWNYFSLKSALNDMLDEDTSEYENVEFKERWI